MILEPAQREISIDCYRCGGEVAVEFYVYPDTFEVDTIVGDHEAGCHAANMRLIELASVRLAYILDWEAESILDTDWYE